MVCNMWWVVSVIEDDSDGMVSVVFWQQTRIAPDSLGCFPAVRKWDQIIPTLLKTGCFRMTWDVFHLT
jgi:hypothetical protein